MDFDDNLKETNIKLFGWNEIIIEHKIRRYGSSASFEMCWNVKGTNHIFRIPLQTFYKHSNGNYEEHFKEVLGIFREDYITWSQQGFTEEWMRKYKKQFGKYIQI